MRHSSVCFLVSLCLGATLALGGCASAGDSADALVGDGLGDTNDPALPVLKSFGVQTELGAPSGADGTPLPDSFNPLGRVISSLGAKREIFLTGVSYQIDEGAYHEKSALMLDDGGASFDPRWADPSTSESWVENPLASAACDLDGDGMQEAVTVYFVKAGGGDIEEKSNPGSAFLTWVDYDPASKKYTRQEAVKLGDAFDLTTRDTGDTPYLMHLACGDTDRDGRDELAVIVGNTLTVVDDQAGAFAPLFGPLDYRAGNVTDGTLHVTRAAGGDINGDGADEFVVIDGQDDAATCTYYVYGGAPLTELASNAISTGVDSLQYGAVALGDIDGDRHLDAVFAGDQPNGDSNYNLVAATWKNGKLAFFPAAYKQDRDWSDHRVMALQVFNPDGLSERARGSIVVNERVIEYDPEQGKFVERFGLPSIVRCNVATGDVLGAKRDQVVFENGDDVFVYGLDDSGDWGEQAKLNIDTKSGTYLSIVAPDADGDSPVVQYTGKHELRFADPQIVAVLASPPFWQEIQLEEENLGNCSTDFSKSTSTGTESAHSFSVSAGVSIGTSFEAPLFGRSVASAEVKATFTASFDYRMATAKSTSIERGFSCPAGEDEVIVTCIPFDVYTYEVLGSPVADDVGDEFVISVPREPQLIAFQREHFNELNAGRQQIDQTVLGHTIGEPRTYADKATMRQRIQASGGNYLWDETGLTVGVSNGLTWDAVTQDESTSQTFGGGIGFSFETETVAGGVLFGTQLGFEYGYEATVETGEGTTIHGAVPDLPPGTDIATYQYQYGIAAYKAGGTYFVVTYWVE